MLISFAWDIKIEAKDIVNWISFVSIHVALQEFFHAFCHFSFQLLIPEFRPRVCVS